MPALSCPQLGERGHHGEPVPAHLNMREHAARHVFSGRVHELPGVQLYSSLEKSACCKGTSRNSQKVGVSGRSGWRSVEAARCLKVSRQQLGRGYACTVSTDHCQNQTSREANEPGLTGRRLEQRKRVLRGAVWL